MKNSTYIVSGLQRTRFLLHICEWLLPIIYLISANKNKAGEMPDLKFFKKLIFHRAL